MQQIQLYIEGQRVEMFKDESVVITDTIKDVRDISKVFTEYSQTFSVPASPTNNKIFKHYYNFNIENGFDARIKKNAFIELNSLPFRNGKIKLEGVDLRSNKAHIYRITFFGSTVSLKDLLGDDKLSDLNFSEFDLDYDSATVKLKLTTVESSANHIIAPLITHTQRLYYNSNTQQQGSEIDGNLLSSFNQNEKHGVKWNELKYAIRVNKIIEAIETKYSIINGYSSNIEFSNDFFKNTNILEFDKLFLWLHRKSGKVEDLSVFKDSSGNTTQIIETKVRGWTPDITLPFEIDANGNFDVTIENENYITTLELTLTPQDVNKEYDVRIELDGNEVYNTSGNTGVLIINKDDLDYYTRGFFTVYITTVGVMTFNNIRWDATYNDGVSSPVSIQYDTNTYTTSASFQFNVNKQMPDIKILDFLTGLFKLFNLTAYVDNDTSQIVVKPLDEYYSSFNTYDITQYVDVSNSSVNFALPFKEIEFKFKDTKSFLANKFSEISNRDWGSVSYIEDNKNNSTQAKRFTGGLYKVEVPFGHMMYERITDENTGDLKDIQWGYSVNESQSAYLGSPLLFYPIRQDSGGISFVDKVEEPVSVSRVFNVYMPSNSVSFDPSINSFQLNFNLEWNEWTRDDSFTDTPYKKYYENYISSVFNIKNRITKITAYLPLKILREYTLADRIVINGNIYKINSIETDFYTGKSELELLNDL